MEHNIDEKAMEAFEGLKQQQKDKQKSLNDAVNGFRNRESFKEKAVRDAMEILQHQYTNDFLKGFNGRQSSDTFDSLLRRIDIILKESAFINQAIEALGNFPPNESPEGGQGDQARADAIKGVVMLRETTNQKMIELLGTMYEDLKPRIQRDFGIYPDAESKQEANQ